MDRNRTSMIEQHLLNIEKELQAIRELIGFNLSATREGDRIRIEWSGEIDEIQWVLDGEVVSLNKMWKTTLLNPPPIGESPYYIGNKDTVDDIESVTVGKGYWEGYKKTYVLDRKETVPVTQEPQIDSVEPYPLLVTLWDSWKNGYKDFDTVKIGKWGDIQQQYDQGKTVIISASHTWEEEIDGEIVLEPEWKWDWRLNRLKGIVKDLDPNRYFIFLQDEPFDKPHWNFEALNRLIKLSKDILPEESKIGMSFTNGSIYTRFLPKALDFYVTPNYPFKTEWAIENGHKRIETKEEYDEDVDDLIKTLRKKIGDKEIYLIGQGFYNTGSGDVKPHQKRWGKPPIEYPKWLYEACWRNGLKGAWWWLLSIKRDHYNTLEDMPELLEEIKLL